MAWPRVVTQTCNVFGAQFYGWCFLRLSCHYPLSRLSSLFQIPKSDVGRSHDGPLRGKTVSTLLA